MLLRFGVFLVIKSMPPLLPKLSTGAAGTDTNYQLKNWYVEYVKIHLLVHLFQMYEVYI